MRAAGATGADGSGMVDEGVSSDPRVLPPPPNGLRARAGAEPPASGFGPLLQRSARTMIWQRTWQPDEGCYRRHRGHRRHQDQVDRDSAPVNHCDRQLQIDVALASVTMSSATLAYRQLTCVRLRCRMSLPVSAPCSPRPLHRRHRPAWDSTPNRPVSSALSQSWKQCSQNRTTYASFPSISKMPLVMEPTHPPDLGAFPGVQSPILPVRLAG